MLNLLPKETFVARLVVGDLVIVLFRLNDTVFIKPSEFVNFLTFFNACSRRFNYR